MKRISLILVVIAVSLVFSFSPLLVSAEESATMLKNSLESVVDEEVANSEEAVEFEPKTYILEEDGNKIELTLVDEKNAVAEMSIHDVPYATVYMYYEYLTADSISLYTTADDSYFGDFNLYADGTMEEIAYVYIPDDSGEESVETSMDEPEKEEDVNTILLPVVSGIVGLVGAGLLYLLFSGRLDKLKKAFSDIVSWFTKKKEELATEEVDLKKFKEDLTAAVCSNEEVKALLQQAYENNKEQYLAFKQAIADTVKLSTEMVGEMKKSFDIRAEEIEKQYSQIKEILIKMVAGNAELVRQGIADEIIKTVTDKESKKMG